MDELILKERELRDKIIQELNKSELPALITKPMIQDIFNQLQIAEQNEYLIAYQNAQEAQETKEQAKKQGGDKKGK